MLTEDRHGIVQGLPHDLPPEIFLRATALTAPGPAIADARRKAAPGRAARSNGCTASPAGCTTACAFDTQATGVETTAEQACAEGHGVCQDFAHIFIAAARAGGVPARYVSGHLFRRDGQHGQEAGHAWAEAWVEDLGWVAFDPLNGISTDDAYVRVACGLDYRDAAPIVGRAIGWRRRGTDGRGEGERSGRAGAGPVAEPVEGRRMTYCLGMLLNDGLIMIADTRTNAGVDDISAFRKLHCLADTDDRCIYAASAGNLSTTQTVISLLREGIPAGEDGKLMRTIAEPNSMFRAAQLVGEAVQLANETVGKALASIRISGASSILLGGRIGDGPPQLFLIYSAGNFIECKPDMPFFQIGETKYGRPILDRAIDPTTSLAEAMKVGFLSFDASIRSNLAVGRPLDLMVMPARPGARVLTRRITEEDPYFNDLSARWGDLLQDATAAIPDPPFMADLGS